VRVTSPDGVRTVDYAAGIETYGGVSGPISRGYDTSLQERIVRDACREVVR
jgi:hypothetical protein